MFRGYPEIKKHLALPRFILKEEWVPDSNTIITDLVAGAPDCGHDRVGDLARRDEPDVCDVHVPDDLLQNLGDVHVDEAAALPHQTFRVRDLARAGAP